jgi:NitT/TauT family transport system substrate-binding protein/putative hydroxymethylpyrimidine transport system substrate-binding protein
VQRPLAAVNGRPGLRSPRALAGERAGVTGLPSDVAVLKSVVRGSGGDPARVRLVTVGFNAVAALLTGRVAAATAFWNVEGVELRARRPGTPVFRVDEFGAPPYPELVVTARRATLRAHPGRIRAAIAALARGYRATRADPARALRDLTRRVPGLDPAVARRQLAAVTPAFAAAGRPPGTLDPALLRAWAAWDVRFGILKRPPDVTRAFDPRFLAAE